MIFFLCTFSQFVRFVTKWRSWIIFSLNALVVFLVEVLSSVDSDPMQLGHISGDSCSLCCGSCWPSVAPKLYRFDLWSSHLVIQTWDDLQTASFFMSLWQVWNCWLWASRIPGNHWLAHCTQHHPNYSGTLLSLHTWDYLDFGVLLILGLQRFTWPHCIGFGSIEPKAWNKRTIIAVVLFQNHSSITCAHRSWTFKISNFLKSGSVWA